jgi:uncharacterized protein (TIGR03032 family)
MASQQIFIVAAPRSGAGLFLELSCLAQDFSRTELSDTSLVEIAADELGIDVFASHSLLDLGLSAAEEQKLIAKLKSFYPASSGTSIDYHPSFAPNVGLLAKTFPEAKFVFVAREFAPAVASGIVAWQSGAFVTEPDLPTWWGTKWSYPLISDWADLIGEPINEIVARQFVDLALGSLSELRNLAGSDALSSSRVVAVKHEQLLSKPEQTIIDSLAKLGITWKGTLPATLPKPKASSRAKGSLEASGIMELARTGIEANHQAFAKLREALVGVGLEEFASSVFESGMPSLGANAQVAEPASKAPKITKQLSEGTPFVAHFSGALPELLAKAKASLIFSAYNSGLVGTVRAEGKSIDTSYIRLAKPMGMALSEGKLAISTMDSILSFNMQNQLASRISGEINPDAVFVPQSTVHTGHLAVHDMAYGTAPGFEGLWFINSAFSCLSLMHADYSFVPKWRPKWISGLAFENRCHLNGLAMVEGAPKYATSLSQADTRQGWREDKGTSGVIVDISTNRLVASGLSMPHSPRWHKNKLYFLESGKGSLASVDLKSGELTTIATLPGFTRGLSFIGDYALVGLSQVRESSFKDLPVTSTKQERNCGIWVVDTRSGKTVATLKFDGVIQELFEIKVVENSRWPIFIDRTPETSTAFVLPKAAIKDIRSSRN